MTLNRRWRVSRRSRKRANPAVLPSPELVRSGDRGVSRRWRPAWVTAIAAAIILCALAFPSGRSLAQRFLATLRIEKVQPVALDFSTFDGNRPLGELLSKMLSDKVVVTSDEKVQHVDSAKDASDAGGLSGAVDTRAHGCTKIHGARTTRVPHDGGPGTIAGCRGPGGAARPAGAGEDRRRDRLGECAEIYCGGVWRLRPARSERW